MHLAGTAVAVGTKEQVRVPLTRLPTQAKMYLPVIVINGVKPGPKVWLSAAIHGDELNGIEIIHAVHQLLDPAKLRGTVFAIPIVNVFGFIFGSRYLPDRRDLNRSFPGSRRGSLASRLAHVLMTEIVAICDYGIDFHTASEGRTNLPQIRGNLDDPETLRCAKAFGAPVVLAAKMRDGSLRQAAAQIGVHTLLFEGGEAHRFNQSVIKIGIRGVLQVLTALKMYPHKRGTRRRHKTELFTSSRWLRARKSGILRLRRQTGDHVVKGEVVGEITDPFGERAWSLTAPVKGVIIGTTLDPLISEGDAVINIAYREEI